MDVTPGAAHKTELGNYVRADIAQGASPPPPLIPAPSNIPPWNLPFLPPPTEPGGTLIAIGSQMITVTLTHLGSRLPITVSCFIRGRDTPRSHQRRTSSGFDPRHSHVRCYRERGGRGDGGRLGRHCDTKPNINPTQSSKTTSNKTMIHTCYKHCNGNGFIDMLQFYHYIKRSCCHSAQAMSLHSHTLCYHRRWPT